MHITRQSMHILLDAFYRFNRDDGWAIASHIALSILMSVFPFLIVVTAITGFIGSVDLANEVARLLLEAWPPRLQQMGALSPNGLFALGPSVQHLPTHIGL